jgi:hypothetical protein
MVQKLICDETTAGIDGNGDFRGGIWSVSTGKDVGTGPGTLGDHGFDGEIRQ